MDKNLNVSINDGEAFFCHELSINFNPIQIIFDFKSITPRVDMRSKDRPSISLKHNVVMLDPFHAKRMQELLTKVIKDYEKDFGKIEKPKAVAALEKRMAEKGEDPKKAVEVPTYFG